MILHLTQDEKKLFQELPADLQNSFKGEIQEEMTTIWETDKELADKRVRAQSAYKNVSDPKEKSFIDVMKANKLGKDFLEKMPQSLLVAGFSALGVRGMTEIIVWSMDSVKNAEDLEAVSFLTEV